MNVHSPAAETRWREKADYCYIRAERHQPVPGEKAALQENLHPPQRAGLSNCAKHRLTRRCTWQGLLLNSGKPVWKGSPPITWRLRKRPSVGCSAALSE